MGPSGCGKSTLLNLVGGLDRPTGGEVEVDGVRVDRLSEAAAARFRRTNVGFVFQFFHLLDDLTVADNIAVAALLAGRSSRTARSACRRAARPARAGRPRGRLSRRRSAAASGSAWRSPGRSSTDRPCSSPTSRPARSTAATARPRSRSSRTSIGAGRRSCWSPTTSSSRSAVAHRIVRLVDGVDRRRPADPAGGVMGAVRTKTRRRPPPAAAADGRRSPSSCSSARGAATLALSILVESQEPFDHAFAAANGAHSSIDYDGRRRGAPSWRRRRRATGVTASAGPWPVAAGRRGAARRAA